MHTTIQKNIVLDELKFKKLTKKLATFIKEDFNLDIKLSQSQELISKSLGFRNFNELQKSLVTDILENEVSKNVSVVPQRNKYFLEEINPDQINQIFYILIGISKTQDQWQKRAFVLMSILVNVVKYLHSIKKIPNIKVDTISYYLDFNNLISLHKEFKDLNIKEMIELGRYFSSLPGFQESAPKQHMNTIEQHGFLQMQFLSALSVLQKIEDRDFIIYDSSWFILNVNNEYELKENLKNIYQINNSWIFLKHYFPLMEKMKAISNRNTINVSDLLINNELLLKSGDKKKSHVFFNKLISNYIFCERISTELVK